MSAALGGAALWALVLLPGLVGAVLCAAGRRAGPLAGPVALVTVVVVAGLAAAVAWWTPTVAAPFVLAELGLAVDALAALVVPAVAVVTALVVAWVVASGAREERVAAAPAAVHGVLLLFLAAVLLTATASTLPALLLGWEVMGAASYALIAAPWREHRAADAGLTAFLTTRAADLGLYVAVAAALAGGAGLGLADLPDAQGIWRDVAAAGLLVAALGKAAQLPFSAWLSRAMEGPSPVSALLHSAAMVAMGGYLLLRTSDLLAATGWAATAAAWVGVLTALLLGLVALTQSDLKQVLAASTASQLGFVVLAAGTSPSGGAAHLVAHAATKAALFLAAGVWLQVLGTKALDRLDGAARRTPGVGAAAVVAGCALAGVAPLSLWATKDAVLAGALETSPWLYACGLAAAAVAAAYAARLVTVLLRRPPAESPTPTAPVSGGQTAAVVALAAGAAGLGVLALPGLLDPLGRALTGAAPPHPGVVEVVGTAVLVLVVGAVVVVLTRRDAFPRATWAEGWLGLGRLTHAGVVRPVLGLAGWCARVDDHGVDRAVHAVATLALAAGAGAARADDGGLDAAVTRTSRGTVGLAGASARVDDGVVDAGVERVAAGARGLGRLARRPQTGRVDEYYLQLVTGLAVLLGLAVVLLLVVV
ncbi:proton-conducting transporter membrane subunit [Aquipuribacter nitratireducens]|uniref:Proton-conducting transporter membrane subunit n=1 Tax=Aquipuribacter nitratireducens TaxID=650104 RepID=A0ABW0GLV1_9MICO